MTRYLRLYQSAVDPADVEEIQRLFVGRLLPVMTACPGCVGMELAVSVEPNAGGLVGGAAISRWTSLEAMADAVASPAVLEALGSVRLLLRQEPVVRVFEVLG